MYSPDNRINIDVHQRRLRYDFQRKLQDVLDCQLESLCHHAEYSEYWILHTIIRELLDRLARK